MMVNHEKSAEQIKHLVFCLLLTCLITSVFGILQIPGGARVSALFECEGGKHNTLNGYLLFIGAIAGGLSVETDNSKLRHAPDSADSHHDFPFPFYAVAFILSGFNTGLPSFD